MKNQWVRTFAAVFAGFWVFFFLYSFIVWALTYFAVSPYGELVATFFKGRTAEESKAFLAGNRALYEEMLPGAVRFSNLVINPVVGLVSGLVAGFMLHPGRRKAAALFSIVAIIPALGMLFLKTGGDPLKVLYIAILLAFTAAGGVIGNKIKTKRSAGGPDVHA